MKKVGRAVLAVLCWLPIGWCVCVVSGVPGWGAVVGGMAFAVIAVTRVLTESQALARYLRYLALGGVLGWVVSSIIGASTGDIGVGDTAGRLTLVTAALVGGVIRFRDRARAP